jgi:hypothetical protein
MKRADIVARLPICLGLPIHEAAAAIGVSEGHFRKMQGDGLMPRCRDLAGVPRIDTEDLARAFRAMPYVGDSGHKRAPGVDEWQPGDAA